jgi:dolichyl-diphosphooligosaccharide--protein glycosyltransferase
MSEEDKKDADDAPSKKRLGRKQRARNSANKLQERNGEQKGRRRTRRKSAKRPSGDLDESESQKSQGRLWFEQNWKIVAALTLIFLFGLFLRSYYYYGPATEDGFILSGNDPYYHKRVVDYVQDNGEHLVFDPLLSYPDGAHNPRPPLFDWSIAIVGLLLAPFFGGNSDVSTWQVMEFAPAFWGALTAIPVYLIAKEIFNKKVGLICAFLLATMPSHVERSPLGFSDHDAIVLFFVVLAFFFFIKTLNQLRIRNRWIENYKNLKSIPSGIREWGRHNQVSIAYALLTGLSLATVALIWKGFLYAVVIIIVYFFIQMVINKLRNKDSLGVAMCTIITLAVVAFLPMPYYLGNNLFAVIRPASEILIAVIIVSAVLVPTRDSPWVLVFTVLGIVLTCGFVLMVYVFPEIGTTYFSGQGYFAKTKIFSTIAEGQAPDYSRAMFSYGVVTAFLALFGILWSIVRVAKDLKTHYLFMTIWACTALYMTISATRFIFNAAPIFAVLAGWVVYEIVVRIDFRKMMKHYRSLKGGGRIYAVKKSVKISHVVGVLFLVFMIIIPNVWLGWDAGVPYGNKKDVDVAVYDALPFFMKPEEHSPDGDGIMYNRSNLNDLKYFGAFGHGFPSDYWLDSMEWLSEQDTDLPIEDRPAFISWWDYGFWSIYLGEHPTAADNFQGKVHFAGSFIAARNESEAISLLIARILETDQNDYRLKDGHATYRLHDGVRTILRNYVDEDTAKEIEDIVVNPDKYRSEVLNNPDKYGHYASDMDPNFTPIYAILQARIPELLTDDERVWLLHDLQEETGYSMRYFAIDSRLFPFGPQNTGIYYAPLKLSDHRVDDNNEPYDFLRTIITDSNSRENTLDEFRKAQENDPELEVRDISLRYYEPFLESMLLKCYLGYTLEDIGAPDPGEADTKPTLPGMHQSTQNYIPMQAWMMKHFQLVYRTSYWNPYNSTIYQQHPDAWEAMLDTEASALVDKLENDGMDNDNNGLVDDEGEGGVVTSGLRSGVVYIKYYEGAYLNGTVKTRLGQPVPGVRVTVADDYGIPHDSQLTDENGTYNLLAPSGNVSVYATTGGFGEGEFAPFNVLTQREEITLNDTNIEISDDQVMRREIDDDGDGVWDYYITWDFEIEPNVMDGKVFWDLDDDGVYNQGNDENITAANIILYNLDKNLTYVSETQTDGSYNFTDLTPGTYNITVEVEEHEIFYELAEPLKLEQGDENTQDFRIRPGGVFGNLSSVDKERFKDQEIKLVDLTNDTIINGMTDSDGNFSFDWLLPGNYSVEVEIEDFESYSTTVFVSQGNSTGVAIVLWPSTDVSGEITESQNNNPVPNATIKFSGLKDNEGIIKFAKSDGQGQYTVDLRNGEYRVSTRHDSGSGSILTYFEEIEVFGGDLVYDIPLRGSVEVFGVVWRDVDENGSIELVETRPYADLMFQGTNWETEVKTNFTGFYRVFLPQGNYRFYTTWETTKEALSGNLTVAGSDRIEYNIHLKNGKRIEGYVWYDRDLSGDKQNDEGLAFATVTFTDPNGTETIVETDFEGKYMVNIPQGVGNYTAVATKDGYDLTSIGPLNVTNLSQEGVSDFELNALTVSVSGVTRDTQGAIVNSADISFDVVHPGVGANENVTAVSGGYSVDLLPGEYYVIVDYNDTVAGKPVRYLFFDEIRIRDGEGTRDYDLDLTKMSRVNGTVSGTTENVTIQFDPIFEVGIEREIRTENGTFEIFLLPGEYTVSVDEENLSSTHLVYINTFNFTESQTVSLNVSVGVLYEGTVEYDSDKLGKIEISFITPNGSLITESEETGNVGKYTIYLPPNTTYEVVINQTVDESGNQIRYTHFATLDVNTTDNTSYDLEVNKYIKVRGTVYLDWDGDNSPDDPEALANVTITFDSGSDSIDVLTNETGKYELYLELGTEFDVNLSADFPISEWEPEQVTPSITVNIFDFKIIPENLTISGRTTFNNVSQSHTALWFTGISDSAINHTSASDAEGNFSVDLSYGEYDVYARKVSGSNVYVFLGQITVRPRENIGMDIELESALRVKGKAYHLNSTGENLTIEVDIEFKDEAAFVTTSNDKGQFELWLPEGNYRIIADYKTTEYNMTMNYTYKRTQDIPDNMILYLNLTKVKDHLIELTWNEEDDNITEIGQNESIPIPFTVTIRNIGNIKDTYDITSTADTDWNITHTDNITLDIGESKTFDVTIQASENARVDHQPIVITATSRDFSGMKEDVDLDVNITQEYLAGNFSSGDSPPTAEGNTLTYSFKLTNVGNGDDNFTLNATGVPEDWNVTVTPGLADRMRAGDTQGVVVEIIIPYNTSVKDAIIALVSTSDHDKISQIEISAALSNLQGTDSNLTITGEDVSEGELQTDPIPGFEAIFMFAALIGVALIMRRRRIQ